MTNFFRFLTCLCLFTMMSIAVVARANLRSSTCARVGTAKGSNTLSGAHNL